MVTDKRIITRPAAKLAARAVLVELKVPFDHELLAEHIAGAMQAVSLPHVPGNMVPKSDYDLLVAKYHQLELINEKLHDEIAKITRKAGS